MKVTVFDNARVSFFDCSSEAARCLVRSLIGAGVLAIVFTLIFSGLARDTAYGQTAPRPTLRGEVIVADAIVTIGDFFDDAGDKAATPLFRAPDLGTAGPVSARRVIDLARTAGLVGADANGHVEVRVTRISRAVEADDLARLIAAEALRQNGRALGEASVDDLRVAFDGPVEPRHADSRATTPARIVSFSLDPQSGRFDTLVQIDQGGSTERLRLRGEVVETVRVVTLTRPLAKGEIVGRDDLVVDRLPRRQIGTARTSDPEPMIGLAARRALRSGQPVAAGDFARPMVVVRGDTVTVVYESAALTITSRGQAQESGAVGDLVGVLNPQSKRTVHATVAGPGKVVVTAGSKAVASIGRTTP